MNKNIIVTAGSTYLDIDAYACSVAMTELLNLKGINAISYSNAPSNYSVCESLVEAGQMLSVLPANYDLETSKYIIVDVSDPEYIKSAVPIDNIIEIYDHHTGFEEYWQNKIGENAHIEFIGAAATLILREWKNSGFIGQMKRSTALLLIAAILDNTLNLTSENTRTEDIEAFEKLCQMANVGEEWCKSYFAEVQMKVEADLKNAIFNDIKLVRDNEVLPSHIGQLCLWNAESIFERVTEIKGWFEDYDSWMINVIDIKNRCSYFMCDNYHNKKELERVFDIHFSDGIARTTISYLRKEIIKKVQDDDKNGG